MKSDGENMNITSIVIIKRVIGFTCVILLLLTNVYAQENEISIDLELVSVWESEYQPSPQGLIKGDTLPEIINFEFIVYNHTDKALMFGSNSHLYYHPDWNNSEYGEIGRFLMINGADTISPNDFRITGNTGKTNQQYSPFIGGRCYHPFHQPLP